MVGSVVLCQILHYHDNFTNSQMNHIKFPSDIRQIITIIIISYVNATNKL